MLNGEGKEDCLDEAVYEKGDDGTVTSDSSDREPCTVSKDATITGK